jgi:hypothetical protein
VSCDTRIAWHTWYMALPEPPSERSRELLQAIWDMSWSRRSKRAAWPTAAALPYASTYPKFRATEVKSLLARMPAGLINSFEPANHEQPANSQELSLTVAGVAACHDTEMTLALFLAFIHYAVLKTSDGILVFDNFMPSKKTQVNYQMGSFDFIRRESRLPWLSARRDKLLQQLHLLLASEPSLWVEVSDYNYNYGDWIVTFDRRIRYFKDARTLDEYWACRFKPWETPGEVPYPVLAANKAPDQASRLQLLYDHPDLLADILLGRIFDRPGGVSSVVSFPAVDPDIDPAVVRQVLRRLEAQGRIRLRDIDTSPDLPNVILTDDGVRHISDLRRGWADHVLRDRAARDALLAWLYERRISASEASQVDEFFRDPRSFYSGQFFSLADIDDAATYLREKKLIAGRRDEFVRSLSSPRITASGIDCIEQGGSVAEYTKPAKNNVNFNEAVTGNVVVGDYATQHAAISGMDAGSLGITIRAIFEALPALDFDAQVLGQTTDAANEVAADIAQRQPNRPHVRAALGRIRDLLAYAGNQTVATVLRATIDAELSRLGIPPAR